MRGGGIADVKECFHLQKVVRTCRKNGVVGREHFLVQGNDTHRVVKEA